ncbi:protein MICROTUBULE BINDING PROTEIN 2C-like [Lycium ferocissimum]|uniref:protein MICROTUBULE BINDING PROTEIN 2C-like n=1 Tax=Lycium ferocissimum TaxID=112874 RepID=UPI00281615DC|nr:protein MICROTUBULE BINDING PROTEIN 2C-like [Lycium ferocissimum]
MYEPQQLSDNNDGFGAGADVSPTLRRTDSSLSNSTVDRTVDRMLFNDLVEIVPLVQSLIDRKAKSSFTRRGSMTYTKTPSRESLYNKTSEAKGKNAAQSNATKKHRDQNKNVGSDQDGCAENVSMLSSRSYLSEKDREELKALREQVEDMQKKLLEKDELLKEVEVSKNEMASIYAKLDEMKKEYEEKDSLLKSTQAKLSDAKVKLADKQAAVEKLEWEATTSRKKVEKLQEDLEVVQREIAFFMQFVQKLTKNGSRALDEDYDVIPYLCDKNIETGQPNETGKQEVDLAREAYIAAIAAAKENQDEASFSAAAKARLYLQSLVLRT